MLEAALAKDQLISIQHDFAKIKFRNSKNAKKSFEYDDITIGSLATTKLLEFAINLISDRIERFFREPTVNRS